jgi:excisionase family DNA binding protein
MGPNMTERILLRPAEFAEAVGISRTKAYELIARGEVPSVRIGGSVRVPIDGLRTWIEQQTAESRARND